MIEFHNLSYQYSLSSHKVLNKLCLKISPGTLTLVTGTSGSGKSTFLRCINGLVPHFTGGIISGQISVFGSNPITEGVEVMAKNVGFVFQEPESQFVFDSVEDELAFSLENSGTTRELMEERLEQVLKSVNLMHLRHKKINQISGGEQQKVAIASALVMQPTVLVLDEPTSQLDPVSADEVLKYILELKDQLNLTVLISEHRLERLLPYTDLIIHLTDQQTVIFGEPQQVLPQMDQVPPIIEISQRLGLDPLPLSTESFPRFVSNLVKHKPADFVPEIEDRYEALLRVEHLSTRLGDRLILKDIELDIRQGEILVLLGHNGAGKTTLLRSILKIIPYSGKITLRGVDLEDLNLSALIQDIAYLPQNPNDLLFAETVLDELLITLKNHNKSNGQDDFPEFLSHFGLADKASRYPRDLSVGERQRTAMAAITVHDPQIIFLDEPTRGLDYHTKKILAGLFDLWRKQGKAILLVTHDVEFAAQLADRVAILAEGDLIFQGDRRVGFTQFPMFQTQTARLFPGTSWITPDDVERKSI